MTAAGFVDIRVEKKEESRSMISGWLPGSNAGDFVVSAKIFASKPKDGRVPKAAAAAEATLARAAASKANAEASTASASASATVKHEAKTATGAEEDAGKGDGGC